MDKLKIRKIADITGGSLVNFSKKNSFVTGVSTDTRKLSENDLFIALTGEKFDGHTFIKDAIEKGASAILISDLSKVGTEMDMESSTQAENVILVKDTLKAYQDIASYVRSISDYKVIAVTGSVGKTSTRQMITSALKSSVPTYSSRGNNNNEIGVPLTILEAPSDTRALVLELGMRAKGEIKILSEICEPDIAIITNIGMSHIEFLGSKENIFKAKSEILCGLSNDGLLILNTDDPYLKELCNESYGKIRTMAVTTRKDKSINADLILRAKNIVSGKGYVNFNVEAKTPDGKPYKLDQVSIPVMGTHNVLNALIGIACAIELDLDISKSKRGLMDYENVHNRQKIIEYGKYTIIDDSYNCSPESLEAGIKLLAKYPCDGRKIAVLAGMLELGEFAVQEHISAGAKCVKHKIDIVLTLGDMGKYITDGVEKHLIALSDEGNLSKIVQNHNFTNQESMVSYLLENVMEDDVILVKGSRSFNMDKVAFALEEHLKNKNREKKND